MENMGGKLIIMSRAKDVAKSLLSTGAVKLNVKEPFTFVSGIKSPIYCDNRKMIGYPVERQVVVDEFIKKLSEKDFQPYHFVRRDLPFVGGVHSRARIRLGGSHGHAGERVLHNGYSDRRICGDGV